MPTKPEVKASANFIRFPIVDENSRDTLLTAPYAYSAQQITSLLMVDATQGLSDKEAEIRLIRDGKNSIGLLINFRMIRGGDNQAIALWCPFRFLNLPDSGSELTNFLTFDVD